MKASKRIKIPYGGNCGRVECRSIGCRLIHRGGIQRVRGGAVQNSLMEVSKRIRTPYGRNHGRIGPANENNTIRKPECSRSTPLEGPDGEAYSTPFQSRPGEGGFLIPTGG